MSDQPAEGVAFLSSHMYLLEKGIPGLLGESQIFNESLRKIQTLALN